MYFNVDILISINGSILIDKVNYVYIKHSRLDMIDTAEVKLASKYIYKGEYKAMTEIIKNGDEIEIYAGYDGNLIKEFSGYIANIKRSTPLVLTCEDEMYKLKREDVKPKSWKSTTLKSVVEYLAGTRSVSGSIPGITLAPFYIKGKLTKLKVLEQLRSQYGIDIYFRNGVLYAGYPYQDSEVFHEKALYHIGYNTIEPNELQYRSKEDIRVKVKVISMQSDNTKLETEIGDVDGELRTIHLYNVPKSTIKERGEEELKIFKFDGYKGSMKAFAIPVCQHGMIAEIDDEDAPDQNSGYFIDQTVFEAGIEVGLRRSAYLGRRAE